MDVRRNLLVSYKTVNKALNSFFSNLRDDNRTASRDGDKELLELCNYYEEEESVPDLDGMFCSK